MPMAPPAMSPIMVATKLSSSCSFQVIQPIKPKAKMVKTAKSHIMPSAMPKAAPVFS